MLRVVLVAASMQNLGQSGLINLIVNVAVCWISLLLSPLVVALNQSGNEFAQEDSTPVAENGSILLRAAMFNAKITVLDHTTFEHNGTWLIDWDLLVTEPGKVVSDTPIVVNDWLLTFARVYLDNVFSEFLIQLFIDFLLKIGFVDHSNGLRHGLNHLTV